MHEQQHIPDSSDIQSLTGKVRCGIFSRKMGLKNFTRVLKMPIQTLCGIHSHPVQTIYLNKKCIS